MGRMLGSFADDQELDRPDLNKCPDCKCFFAGEKCPLCGKECPEEMRAGNRAPVKPNKKRKSYDSGRVSFVEWYHSWWFITIMVLILPIVGVILLATSPYKTSRKVLFIVLAVIYFLVAMFGVEIVAGITDMWDKPVDDSISQEEYISLCKSVTLEEICRSADGFKDKFLTVKLKIVKKVTYQDKYYTDKDYVCYLCEDENGSKFNIVIRDCLLADQQRFIAGDIITVYGEGAGECNTYVYDPEYTEYVVPCVNMAYAVME